jgi:hypothetical protein
MKRLVISVIVVAALALATVPASAQGGLPCTPTANGNGAATCSVNMHDATFVLPGPPPCSGITARGSLLMGNAVFHVTALTSGDEFWETETLEGTFQSPITGPPLSTGHVAAWFGTEYNNQNQVIHSTLDGNGTSPLGSFGFHDNFDLTMNANGDVTAFHNNANCR